MTPSLIETRRTCWAYSPGGHLAELERATAGICFADCLHLTFRSGREPPTSGAPVRYVCHPRRSLLRTLVNTVQTVAILLHYRPEIVISTGADVAVAALIAGRLLGALVIFVETGGTLAPSLTGRLVYPFTHHFIVPWPEKLAAFPKAVLATGPLL